MVNRILENGIYFRQYDEKVEGYYITNENGDSVHREYKEPTTFEKMKFKMKYGYSMNTSTIFTSYFYFNPDFNEVHLSSMKGDAITIGGYCKYRKYLDEPKSYSIEGQKVVIVLDRVKLELTFSEDFKSMKIDSINLKTNKITFAGNYFFLDFGII